MVSKINGQRIGIWIIAVVMTLGTIGSFVVIILANNNAAQDQKDQATALADYQKQQVLSAKQQSAAAQTNADSSEGFDGYTARSFDAAAATSLKVETLVQGTGDTIKATDSINSSYFGWTADGKIFDSSKKKNTDDAPITFALSGVIKGWTEGLTGTKAGSVVRLTIPADKAYGATASGAIPANSPLEFIVKIVKIDNSQTKATQ